MTKKTRKFVSALGTGLCLEFGDKQKDGTYEISVERRRVDKTTAEITREPAKRTVDGVTLARMLKAYVEEK